MAKSKIDSPSKVHPGDALYDACASLGEIRAALVVASEVLSDSAFSGGNAIAAERDCCAVLVIEKAVEHLSGLQGRLDGISAALNQPRAVAHLKAVSHG